MITISLCMIVKNEEKILSRCLTSVKDIVDEIIIVDTGSTDKTKTIAKTFTDKVYDFKWVNDFSKARNYSFSKATKDYILWLDADDVILPKDKEKILNLKNNLSKDIDMVMMKYNIAFDNNGNPTFSYYRERLLKREKNYKWESPIHEVITPSGNIEYTDICITHKKEEKTLTTRNLDIFESMIKANITLDARQLYYYARELMYHKKYKKAILNFKKVLEDNNSWIENKINACLDLANCYSMLNDEENKLHFLFKSFEYDVPRAEVTSNIGIHFMQKENYDIAIYWFKQSLKIQPNLKSGGFYMLEYYKLIPYINLCYSYFKLGNIKLANKYNEKIAKIDPTNATYLKNKEFFSQHLK